MRSRTYFGAILIILGVLMFILGASLFTYRLDTPLYPLINIVGKYSFFFWLPTLIIGIIVNIFERKHGKDQ